MPSTDPVSCTVSMSTRGRTTAATLARVSGWPDCRIPKKSQPCSRITPRPQDGEMTEPSGVTFSIWDTAQSPTECEHQAPRKPTVTAVGAAHRRAAPTATENGAGHDPQESSSHRLRIHREFIAVCFNTCTVVAPKKKKKCSKRVYSLEEATRLV